MKLLIIKMSSLGDVIHTLPAVTELLTHHPDAVIDWVVEEAFADIPALHPGVNRVIPIALRRWRRSVVQSLRSAEVSEFLKSLRQDSYDLIVDAQGLIKSAVVSRLAKGKRVGFDASSSRESAASLAYSRRIAVPPGIHAIDRVRRLFATTFAYSPAGTVDSGLAGGLAPESPTLMFLHGTTWPSKLWPEVFWQALTRLAGESGYRVLLPAGNEEERQRAHRIVADADHAEVLPQLNLATLADRMSKCTGVVTVDTGLGHLAAALGIPLIALYGATDPALTGIRGLNQKTIVSDHLPCIPCRKRNCKFSITTDSSKIFPPCFSTMTPEATWQALRLQITTTRSSPD